MTAALRRRIQERRHDEAGVGLVELLVTMSLAILVLGFVATFAVQTLKVTRVTSERNEDAAQARLTATQLDRVIRPAQRLSGTNPAVQTALPNELVLYSSVDNAAGQTTIVGVPKKVRVWLDTTGGKPVLRQQITAPNASSTAPNYSYTGTPSNRVIGRGIVNTASQPIFTYVNSNGVVLPQPLSAGDRALVAAIRIDLRVHVSRSGDTRPAVITTTLRLPNYYT